MRSILTTCIVFFFLGAVAHSPNSPLGENINKQYLEHLVKKGVDEVRKEKGLKSLVNDEILYKAADFHANYILETKKLSHFEGNENMKTPQMRANHFGAVNYGVGENILYIPFNGILKPKKGKEINVNTYKSAAYAMVQGWVNSPGHYKNIITSDYEVTGVAIKIDYEKKRIYAVQKFAEVYLKYSFEENKEFFTYSDYVEPEEIVSHNQLSWDKHKFKYPYNIKPLKKDDPEYYTNLSMLESARGFTRLRYINGSIYLEMDLNADALLNFISKNKDGLAIEYVNYIPFDCGNEEYYTLPSRRNGKSELSDTLLPPVYRQDLIKGFRPRRKSAMYRIKKELKSKKEGDDRTIYEKIIDGYRMPYYPDKFRYRLAKVPKNLKSGYYEANLVYIKNRQIYQVQHFTGICGEYYQEFNELDYASEFGKVEYLPIAPKRNLSFDFHFKKGVTNYKYSDLKPVLDSLTDDAFVVLSAKIDAYSSVEGSEKINKEIQQKRAKSIINALESRQTNKINPTIHTHTNWALFKSQIKENEKLKELRGLDSISLVKKLQDKEYLKKIEPLLNKQRVAKVNINTVFDLNERTLPTLIKKEYILHQIRMRMKKEKYDELRNNEKDTVISNETYNKLKKLKQETLRELDTLKSIQLFVFNNIKSGRFKPEFIHQLKYLNVDWTETLFLNHFYMEEYFKTPIFYKKFKKEAFKIYTTEDHFYSKGAYNFLRDVIRKWDGKTTLPYFKTEEIQDLLSQIGYHNPNLKDTLEMLKINFWFKAAEYHFILKETNKKNEYLARIYLHYRKREIDENHALKLAKFFVHFEYYAPAMDILNKYLSSTKNEEIIAYIFKLNNYNNIELNNNQFAESCIKIREKLSKKTWCDMFVGSCNISFQVFDHEGLRNFYCKECSEFKNKIQKALITNN